MSSLQQLGRRLDEVYKLIQVEAPSSEEKFVKYATPQFLNLIDSNTSLELESRIIKGMNGWIDLLEMELKGLFEKIN